MKLFVKIFLWFLAAIALMVGVIIFVTRTFQTDPLFTRLQRSTRSQMQIYAGTATQIAAAEDEAALRIYLDRLRDVDPPRDVNLIDENGKMWFGSDDPVTAGTGLAVRSLANNSVETDTSSDDRTLGAAPMTF